MVPPLLCPSVSLGVMQGKEVAEQMRTASASPVGFVHQCFQGVQQHPREASQLYLEAFSGGVEHYLAVHLLLQLQLGAGDRYCSTVAAPIPDSAPT